MAEFNFKPFDKVLVRAEKEDHWEIDFFGRIDEVHEHHYVGTAGCCYVECIPYNDDTAHLLGTTDDYAEPYIPKVGDFVAIEETLTNGDKAKWICIFDVLGKDEIHYLVGLSSDSSLLRDGNRGYYKRDHKESFRLATEEEKQFLLSRLEETGKKWNPEKKCIENVWTPKDGDFVNRYDKEVLICKRPKKDEDGGYAFHIYASLTLDDNYLHTYGEYAMQLKLRPATDSEKQQLLDALHKGGKDWDESKKEIVEYKWKPNTNDKYYYVNSALIVDSDCWTSDLLDEQRYRISNCFRTHEEAQAMADKFKKLLKGCKE